MSLSQGDRLTRSSAAEAIAMPAKAPVDPLGQTPMCMHGARDEAIALHLAFVALTRMDVNAFEAECTDSPSMRSRLLQSSATCETMAP